MTRRRRREMRRHRHRRPIPDRTRGGCINVARPATNHPSGAKAQVLCGSGGTAKAVPFQSPIYAARSWAAEGIRSARAATLRVGKSARQRWSPPARLRRSRAGVLTRCYGSTSTSTPLAASFWWKTCSVAFLKSSGFANGMSVKVCGLRSVRGNQELSTWTMMRWPRRKV